MKKMKDIHSSNVFAVKDVIFHVFGMIQLPFISKKKNLKEISKWKSSFAVVECYRKLFELGSDGMSNINHIAHIAYLNF